jgi:DNA repair protein REV1
MKVVTPEWLTESVREDILLPWENYIFQHSKRPEMFQGFKPRETQTRLPANSPKVAPTSNPIYMTDPTSTKEAVHVPHYAADKSNPNAQRVMANADWRKAHTSVAPDFIEGYYKNSRLHHLSTWKAELKHLVQEAQERAEQGVQGKVGAEEDLAPVERDKGISMRGAEFILRSPSKRDKGKAKEISPERVIMHCDFDCFFVSAGLTKRPELKGKPVVVCHSQGGQGGASSTSEIASASYECRKFGIKNGMRYS